MDGEDHRSYSNLDLSDPIDYQIEMYWTMVDFEEYKVFIEDVLPGTTNCPECELV